MGKATLSLREPGPHHGLWLTAHPRIVETAGAAGPDFVCLDAQHGTDLASLTPSIFETLARFGVPGLVRVPGVDPFASDYRPICAIQIETAGALAELEAIASVDGVDWLYVGPADLGLSVGGVPAADVVSVFDGSHPLAAQLTSAFSTLVDTARAMGSFPASIAGAGRLPPRR